MTDRMKYALSGGSAVNSESSARHRYSVADTAHIGKMTATQVANAFFSSTPAHFVSSTSSGMPPPPPKMPFVSPAATPLRRYFVFFSMSPTP